MVKWMKVITWARWEHRDPFETKYFTLFTASVLHPSFEFPVPCLTMSVSNAGGRILLRYLSLADLGHVFVVPDAYHERLEDGFREAVTEAGKIQTQLRAMMHLSNLSPGSQVVRTDTGEIIAQAEDILRGKETDG